MIGLAFVVAFSSGFLRGDVGAQLSLLGVASDGRLIFGRSSLSLSLFGLVSGFAKGVNSDDISVPSSSKSASGSSKDEEIYQNTGTPKLILPFPVTPFYGFVLIGVIPILSFIAYRTYSSLALIGVGLCMIMGIPAVILGCFFGP